MSSVDKKLILRWMVVIAIMLNVVFNYIYFYLPFIDTTIQDISVDYRSLFTPAPYAFSIWALIYLSFIGYAVFQLIPKNKQKRLYDRLAEPMTFANLLGICWIIAYTHGLMLISISIMAVLLINALMMFKLVRNRIRDCEYTPWLTVPFSLYAGWITVAAVANITQGLVALGWHGGILGETIWAIFVIILTGSIALLIGLKQKDWIFPAVASWALIAIAIADKAQDALVAMASFIAGLVLGLFSAIFALVRIRLYTQNPSLID